MIEWSPVTMITLIPASWHFVTACGTRTRGIDERRETNQAQALLAVAAEGKFVGSRLHTAVHTTIVKTVFQSTYQTNIPVEQQYIVINTPDELL